MQLKDLARAEDRRVSAGPSVLTFTSVAIAQIVVSRWRDPQLQVSENLFRFDKMEVNCFQILLNDVTFYI